jgi:uncharacterized protein YggE
MEGKTFWGKEYVHVLLTIILIGVIIALAAYSYYTLKQSEGVYTGAAVITVQGEGEVFAVPDLGQFSFSVMTEGATATEAQNKSAESMNAVITYLKDAGVAENDIKTENYYLNPKYRYETAVCTFNYCPPSNPVIDGYEVSQMVVVKVRDLAKSGELISGVGENGATNISGLSFTIDDESVIKAQAREKAIADAKVKAEKLAKDLGVRIVRMTGYWEEQGGYYPMYERAYGGDMMNASAMVAPDMPIGENTIKSSVSITYEVK